MKNSIIIFTDGSSLGNPGPGGWGAIVSDGKIVVELGGREAHTTNNRMELTGAIEALKSIKGKKGDAVIHTDSRYVINGITSWIMEWEKRNWMTKQKKPVENKDLWEILWRLVNERDKKKKFHGSTLADMSVSRETSVLTRLQLHMRRKKPWLFTTALFLDTHMI